MNSHQTITKDELHPLQSLDLDSLDLDTVCEQKPSSVVTDGRSIIPWHILATVFRLFRKIISMPLQTPISYFELTGAERNSGEKITVVYIGDNSSYEYVISSVFDDVPEIVCQRKIPWWSVNRQIQKSERVADILVGDFDFPLDFLVKKHKALNLPRWLKQKVVIANQWKDVLALLRRKTRREALRSIRKHNLTARVVRDDVSDHYFYHELYKPYIHRRYGTQATLVDEQRFLKECATGRQLQILQDDKILGVVLVHISGKQLTLAWTGVDKNVEGNQLNGVTDALDLYSLMFAYTQGCDVMDMGGTRPLVNDGVLRYKKKWGAAVSQGVIPKGSIFFQPCRINKVVECFLENTPMILSVKNKMCCVSWVFLGEEESIEMRSVGVGVGPFSDESIEKFTEQFNAMYQPGLDEFQGYLVVEYGEQENGHQELGQQQQFTGIIAGLPYRINCVSRGNILTMLANQ